MTMLKVEFTINTEADPSQVFDLSVIALESMVEYLHDIDEPTSGSEDDVSVTEVRSGNV
jgi:hypothetical protein